MSSCPFALRGREVVGRAAGARRAARGSAYTRAACRDPAATRRTRYVTRTRQLSGSRYPSFVVGAEGERRWRLVTMAALTVYGFEEGKPVAGYDRVLVDRGRHTFFDSNFESGDGDLTVDQLAGLRALGLL